MYITRIEKFIIKRAGSLEAFEKLPWEKQKAILAKYWAKYPIKD